MRIPNQPKHSNYNTVVTWNPLRNFEYDKHNYPNDAFPLWFKEQLLIYNVSIEQLVKIGIKESTLIDWYNHKVKKPRANQAYKLIDAIVKLSNANTNALRDSLSSTLKLNKDKRYKQL